MSLNFKWPHTLCLSHLEAFDMRMWLYNFKLNKKKAIIVL